MTKHIIIIGNGVAGITAARHLRKRTDHRITVIGAESAYHYSRPALMYAFMGHMEHKQLKPYEDWFWSRNRIGLVHDVVRNVDTATKTVQCASGITLSYDTLILATGSKGRVGDWRGTELHGVQTFTSLQDLDALERNVVGAHAAVIVGGGLIGVEVAEMLRTRGVDVHMLVREASYWSSVLPSAESAIVLRHIRSHGVEVHCLTELAEIEGRDGRVSAVVTTGGDRIACGLVVLAIGVEPVTHLATNMGLDVDRGICVNDLFETSASDVYAIGDCAQFDDGRVDLLWYTARAHGEHVAGVIAGVRAPYVRGVFFNSAKFFDLEYQTYGMVPSTVDDAACWTWAASDGLRYVRIATTEDGNVVGVNALGVRMRHLVWEAWIREKRPLPYALQHLDDALFEPEFSITRRPLLRAAGAVV